jgi:hypothetical protein
VVDRELNVVYYWKAYQRAITHLKQGVQRNIMVTVGNEEDSIEATVKVWNLEVLETLGYAHSVRSFQVGHMMVSKITVVFSISGNRACSFSRLLCSCCRIG